MTNECSYQIDRFCKINWKHYFRHCSQVSLSLKTFPLFRNKFFWICEASSYISREISISCFFFFRICLNNEISMLCYYCYGHWRTSLFSFNWLWWSGMKTCSGHRSMGGLLINHWMVCEWKGRLEKQTEAGMWSHCDYQMNWCCNRWTALLPESCADSNHF